MQALWKGYSLRRKSKSKRLTLVRQRVEEANAAATEEKKLGNRTSSALDYLLKYKHLSPVLDALKHLGKSLVAFNMLNLREMDTFSGEATLSKFDLLPSENKKERICPLSEQILYTPANCVWVVYCFLLHPYVHPLCFGLCRGYLITAYWHVHFREDPSSDVICWAGKHRWNHLLSFRHHSDWRFLLGVLF